MPVSFKQAAAEPCGARLLDLASTDFPIGIQLERYDSKIRPRALRGPVGTNGCPQGDTAGMLLGSAGDIDGDDGCHRGLLSLRD
jgi:hypothetical protein